MAPCTVVPRGTSAELHVSFAKLMSRGGKFAANLLACLCCSAADVAGATGAVGDDGTSSVASKFFPN